MKFKRSRLALSVSIAITSFSINSSADEGWYISGQNRFTTEYYGSSGDAAGSPYRNEGSQYFNDISLSFSKRNSAFDRINGNFIATVNESEYRGNERGLIVNSASATWEKGDGAVPFRLQGGDFFASQSQRTLQRGLKGAQFEFQPSIENGRQSFQLFAGRVAGTWRDFDNSRHNIFTGGSWLYESDDYGAIALTGIHHEFEGSSSTATDSRNQQTYSLAWEKPFKVGNHNWLVETELAHFSGDYDQSGGEDRDGNGYYVTLSGKHNKLPLDYRILYENYDQHFRPSGAAVSSDRETIDTRLGWRFKNSWRLRGRLQQFTDALESSNQTETQLVGVNVSGPLAWITKGSSLTADSYIQTRENEDSTTDSRTQSINLNLSAPVVSKLRGRLNLSYTDTNDYVSDNNSINRQAGISLDRSLDIKGWKGIVSPGIVFRNSAASNSKREDINPSFSLSLRKANHSVSFSHNLLIQNSIVPSTTDSTTNQTNLRYTYRKGQHSLAFDGNRFDREPDGQQGATGYKLGFTWTYSFEKIPEQTQKVAFNDAQLATGFASITEIPLGTERLKVDENLLTNGWVKNWQTATQTLFDGRLFPFVAQRQRLVASYIGSNLSDNTLIIDFTDVGDLDSIQRTYQRITALLLRQYGNPTAQFERGEFDNNIVNNLQSEDFIRIIEWKTEQGVVRFGIPRRTDGQVRIEIRYGKRFTTVPDNNWGIEGVL